MTITYVLIILLIPLTLYGIYTLYRNYYKNRINKALNEGIPVRVVEPIHLLFGLSMIILLTMSFINNDKITTIYYRTSGVNSNIDKVEREVFYLREYIERLEDEIKKLSDEQKIVQDVESEIIRIDESDNSRVIVGISFTLKELKSDSVVSIVIDDGNGSQQNITVESDSLSFYKEVSLDMSKSYDIDVYIENDITTIQEELIQIDLEKIMKDRIKAGMAYVEFDNEGVDFKIQIRNSFFGVEEFKIDNVQIDIYSGDNKTETIVLNSSVFINDELNLEIFEKDISLGSGEDVLFKADIIVTDLLGNKYNFTVGF